GVPDPANVSVVNDGAIGADAPPGGNGPSIAITGSAFTNNADGVVQATGGGVTEIDSASWRNAGRLTETNPTLTLGGSFPTAGVGISGTSGTGLVRSGGAVNLTGTLDNTGDTLVLDSGTAGTPMHGSWNLAGGTIKNGTVDTTGGTG